MFSVSNYVLMVPVSKLEGEKPSCNVLALPPSSLAKQHFNKLWHG